MKKKKEKLLKDKHPKDMTSEEAIEHLFTRKGKEHIKKHVEKLECSSTKEE